MKNLFLLLAVLFVSVAARAQTSTANPSLAEAILADTRLISFVNLMEKNYQTVCTLPSKDHLVADIHTVGDGGDFTSVFHRFIIPCRNSHDLDKPVSVDGLSVKWVNLSGIEVYAEVNLPIIVLNLEMTGQFRR